MPTLHETRIRAAKPAEKPYKLFDEHGLFLLVTPAGGRLWRLRYRMAGVEKLLALGAYPDVPLKRAREKRDEARKLVADGIAPCARRQAERSAAANTFQAITDEWLVTKKQSLTAATWQRDHDLLYRWVVPYIGNRPIATIEAP
ncbi:integrase family protein, partial [mine drainage metagenome]